MPEEAESVALKVVGFHIRTSLRECACGSWHEGSFGAHILEALKDAGVRFSLVSHDYTAHGVEEYWNDNGRRDGLSDSVSESVPSNSSTSLEG